MSENQPPNESTPGAREKEISLDWKLAQAKAKEALTTGGFVMGVSATGDGFGIPFCIQTDDAKVETGTGKKIFSAAQFRPNSTLESSLDSRNTDRSVGRRFRESGSLRDHDYIIRKEDIDGKTYLMLYASTRDATNREGFRSVFIGWDSSDAKMRSAAAALFPTLAASSPETKAGSVEERTTQLATLIELWRGMLLLKDKTLNTTVASPHLRFDGDLEKYFGPPDREEFIKALKSKRVKPY